ncbi:restriction endonuclease-like protein [Neobacillus niacini]|uniref:restriction endonuclease-like protein n=1 Tax=Neobacillus niacini TaxID=86668 RepID=UPI0021CB9920|nr:restriction endonuclease-like protein [Neobacillus niacini]MCM3764484.1 restriction endonuclease-like protein [Neobacillus niacini]
MKVSSLLSGSGVEDVELVVIETSELILYIKGKPFHEQYSNLKAYRKMKIEDRMHFSVDEGSNVERILVFDVNQGDLALYDNQEFRPIFFENGVYQLVVTSKKGRNLSFNHENQLMRKSVGMVGSGLNKLMIGNLHFLNEIGYSTFEIFDEDQLLLKVTLEVFPSKLDYKEDYKQLLDEVNKEIYNLAFHFIKKTYMQASSTTSKYPSWAEFYRLLDVHFTRFMKAIKRIEIQPYHVLTTTYQKSRGDQIRRVDTFGRNYLRKRPHLFLEVKNGITINHKNVMPSHGMSIKKSLTYDTLENKFVKWMIKRLINKLDDLHKKLTKTSDYYEIQQNEWLVSKITEMRNQLKQKMQTVFWRNIGNLDRSVMSLVIQMAPGYRDAYQIYLIVSRGLNLNSSFYKMSVKDVAVLYEYWTFIKLGQILSRKYISISNNIIKVNRDGLFVNLDKTRSASWSFEHPITSEKIILHFQRSVQKLPTVSQKPDTILSIEKKGKSFSYKYIFDAKYRMNFADSSNDFKIPVPLEEDINTMHRYRDALVVKHGGPYEREAFGAYVLFPGFNEKDYEDHSFYKSINEVNIGGLPFLPNTTRMVEQFIENLIEKSPEEIQKEGILPKGTKEDWISSLDDKVMVVNVNNQVEYRAFKNEKFFILPVRNLKKGWQEAKYIALYLSKDISKELNGVYFYSQVEEVQIVKGTEIQFIPTIKDQDYAFFKLKPWETLGQVIRPVQYGISVYVLTTLNTLKYSNELPELFMKSNEEVTLWRMMRRISNHIKVHLDENELDNASNITYLNLRNIDIHINHVDKTLVIENSSLSEIMDLKDLESQPSKVFKVILRMIE